MYVENHPNGFTKIIIGTIFGYRIRLHYWPKGADKAESRHNHRWWFISVPLLGRFVDNRYMETEDSQTMRIKVLDRNDIRDSKRAYVSDGTSGLRLRRTHIRKPLIPYVCRLGEIHSYYPEGDGRHASLVMISPLKTKTSDIWRDPDELDVELEGPEAHTQTDSPDPGARS
jgi:hypothetical protein